VGLSPQGHTMNVSPQLLERPRTQAPAIAPTVTTEPKGSPFRFVIRCLIEDTGDQWQAFSLELGLAAQAETEAEVRQKLESMIHSYLEDAICGEDREHAYELLSRKATWSVYLKYHLISHAYRVAKVFGGMRRGETFSESLPLMPRHC
jgi:predicted RNase H-like HicB family nuclease